MKKGQFFKKFKLLEKFEFLKNPLWVMATLLFIMCLLLMFGYARLSQRLDTAIRRISGISSDVSDIDIPYYDEELKEIKSEIDSIESKLNSIDYRLLRIDLDW